jgi:hypothetical protein
MRLTRRTAFVAALALGVWHLSSAPSVAQSGDEAVVMQAVEDLRKAILQADRSRLEALVADELSYGHACGNIQTKAQFVDVIVNKETIYKSIALTEPVVVIVGADAIARHTLVVESESAGKTTTTRIGILQVWVKRDDHWKLLARQAFKL